MIAHQRMVPVTPAPSYRRSLYADALYAEAMEPIIMVMPARRYNPVSFFDETVTSSLQVIFLSNPSILYSNWLGLDLLKNEP